MNWQALRICTHSNSTNTQYQDLEIILISRIRYVFMMMVFAYLRVQVCRPLYPKIPTQNSGFDDAVEWLSSVMWTYYSFVMINEIVISVIHLRIYGSSVDVLYYNLSNVFRIEKVRVFSWWIKKLKENSIWIIPFVRFFLLKFPQKWGPPH